MLQHIELYNFKAARDLKLPLAPLTVLAGLNGSGKSTLLQMLSALRQSYLGGHRSGLSLSGTLVQLGHGGDILSENAEDEEDVIGISVREDGVQCRWTCFSVEDAN